MAYWASKPALRGGLFLLGLAVLLAAVGLLFGAALPGIVHFDDKGNLSGLSSIETLNAAWHWALEGSAGPGGRPLALASFALQYYQWPNPAPLLAWNIAIHAINALLVLWLSVLVLERVGVGQGRALAAGFWVAFLWAALPLLNTSVLFIVQRMTLLSATFVLVGLVFYLKLRASANAPWWHQVGALLVLAVCGVLALLAKESGALIVVYALVLELLLSRHTQQRKLPLAAWALVGANLLLLIALLRHAYWSEALEMQRGYTMPDRLGSQGLMLLVYLKSLFLPVAADLNPFRFEYFLRDQANVRWGIVIWLALMLLPVFAWLRRWYVLALVLAWFFFGHVMESSWIGLEPYFAHRNYLPALGLVFALVCWVLSKKGNPRLWRTGFVLYTAVLASVTWMNTSLWGNRALAAEIWAIQEPKSIRAALNLGYELERTQGLGMAQHYLDRFMREHRDSAGLRLQSLISACTLDPDTDHSALVRNVKHAIQTLPYEGWATDLVENLLDITRIKDCSGVSTDQVAEIASTFLERPVYQFSRPSVHNLLAVLGVIAAQRGHSVEAMDFFMQALEHSMSYGIAEFYLALAQQQGDVASIRALQALMKHTAVPKGTSAAKWQELRSRVDAKAAQ